MVTDTAHKLNQIQDLISRPVRAEEGQKVAFIFSGQGTAYCQMGLPLMSYLIFRHTLEAFDLELAKLGCQWSLFGKSSHYAHLMQESKTSRYS